MSLADELDAALGVLPLRSPEDVAIRALSRRYADDIDEAASTSIEGAWLISLIEGLSERQSDVERARRFVAKVDQTQVLGLLGPKLQAALETLEMTPRSRASLRAAAQNAAHKGQNGPAGGEEDDDISRQRRERAAARERHA